MGKIKEKDLDELDRHTPLYDNKEFREWVETVVLPAIRKKPIGTRQLRARIGSALGDERRFDLATALNWLIYADKIWTVEKHVTMYTNVKPKEKPYKHYNWNDGIGPRGQTVPHFQDFIPEGTA